MPKVVKLAGDQTDGKDRSRPTRGTAAKEAEIIIFPGVRYERLSVDGELGPVLSRS